MPRKSKSAPKTKSVSSEKKEKPIGQVIHYFSNIGVAVVKLSAPVSAGQEVRIAGGENTDFNQTIESMEMEHQKLKKAKKGQEVGMKVKEKVREGYKMYKV